jgi:transcriptional regulator with XRE-family HTH domain
MPKIDPRVLRACRDRKNWSQEELAAKSRVDKATISRLERGEHVNARPRTIAQLSKQLGVPVEALTGDVPLQIQGSNEPDKSQMNVRIDNAARNALALVSSRYRIPQSSIVELAPFLFLHAAEQSLRQRAANVAELERKLDEVGSLGTNFPHLTSRVHAFWEAKDILAEEKKSIKARELFLTHGDSAIDADALKDNYDDWCDSPFVSFLTDLARQIGEDVEFEYWLSGPSYRICHDEALQITGGDQKSAKEILSGDAPLHEMPKELRTAEQIVERVKWINEQAREMSHKLAEKYGDVFDLIGDVEVGEAK